MKVKELITNLLDCPMDATILIELPTESGYVSTEKIDHVGMIDDERCLISED